MTFALAIAIFIAVLPLVIIGQAVINSIPRGKITKTTVTIDGMDMYFYEVKE